MMAHSRSHLGQPASQAGSLKMLPISAIDSPFRSLSVLMKRNAVQSRKFPTVGLFALAMLGLAGCSQYPAKSNFSSNERDEISDIAGDAAGSAIEDSEKVSELEAKVEELEGRIEELESKADQ